MLEMTRMSVPLNILESFEGYEHGNLGAHNIIREGFLGRN